MTAEIYPNGYYFINIFLALLALQLYIIGSYRLYKNQKGFIIFLGLAITIDILTALLASLKITPTLELEGTARIPWHSLLFFIHVILSMIGFSGFIFLFIYLVYKRDKPYSEFLRKWQFVLLLPIWITGETIALLNATSKIFFRLRIFELI